MQHLTGFATLADQYDAFILDLWGVIHDGIDPPPGAIDCEPLRVCRRLVSLSNAAIA